MSQSIYTYVVVISSPCVYLMQSVMLGAAPCSRNKKVGLALCRPHMLFMWTSSQVPSGTHLVPAVEAKLNIPWMFTISSKASIRYSRRWRACESTPRPNTWKKYGFSSYLLSFLTLIHLTSLIHHTDTMWHWGDNIESIPSLCLHTVLSIFNVARYLIISTVLWSRSFYMHCTDEQTGPESENFLLKVDNWDSNSGLTETNAFDPFYQHPTFPNWLIFPQHPFHQKT